MKQSARTAPSSLVIRLFAMGFVAYVLLLFSNPDLPPAPSPRPADTTQHRNLLDPAHYPW